MVRNMQQNTVFKILTTEIHKGRLIVFGRVLLINPDHLVPFNSAQKGNALSIYFNLHLQKNVIIT